MFNKNLISVRIDEDTLKMMDEWCRQSRYIKRSRLINDILFRAMRDCLTDNGKPIHTEKSLYRMKLTAKFD